MNSSAPHEPREENAPPPVERTAAGPVTGSRTRWTGRSALSLDLLDNRYPSLHGLRVLAILSVVQLHVTYILSAEPWVRFDETFLSSSLAVFFGMDLFFVLSGFLIGSILFRSIETNGSQNLRRFYIRRAARTFPAYYVVLTFLALTTALTAQQAAHLPWEYAYGTNFLPLTRYDVVMSWGWSLALEEQFYLTVPLLFLALTRLKSDRGRLGLLGGLWALALAIRLAIYLVGRPWVDVAFHDLVYFAPYTRFDALICGIVIAFVHRRWGPELSAWLAAPFHRGVVALGSLSCLWLLMEPDVFGKAYEQLVHVFAWGTLTSLMYLGWLLLMLHGDQNSWLSRALAWPPFRSIATLGYGVYLVHMPLFGRLIVPTLHTLHARGVSLLVLWPLAFTALLLGSFGIAYVLHVAIEKPALRLRDRMID